MAMGMQLTVSLLTFLSCLASFGALIGLTSMALLIPTVIIGYGYIGRRHTEIVRHHPQFELVGVVDTDADKRAAAIQDLGLPVAETLDALLAQLATPPELCCICTPNNSHTPLAQEALAHGQHVVIEKPMGLSRSACEAVIHQALSVHRHVFVVMQNRFTPAAQWLKQLVTEDRLGRILYAQVNCFWNRDGRYYTPGHWHGDAAQDGGTLYTQFSHFVDILYWLVGDVHDIQASAANLHHGAMIGIDDAGAAVFRLEGGGYGTLNFTTAVYDRNLESSITLIGERGSVKVGGQYMHQVLACHVEGYTVPELPAANPPNDYGPYQGSAANHGYIFDNVAETLRSNGRPATSALEGLKVVDIIERIYAAARFQPNT